MANQSMFSVCTHAAYLVVVLKCRHGSIGVGISALAGVSGVSRLGTRGGNHGRSCRVLRIILFLVGMCTGCRIVVTVLVIAESVCIRMSML